MPTILDLSAAALPHVHGRSNRARGRRRSFGQRRARPYSQTAPHVTGEAHDRVRSEVAEMATRMSRADAIVTMLLAYRENS